MSKDKKLNNVAVDFQPDAVEIAMRPVPVAAKLGVSIAFVFFIGALVASHFSKVDMIVNGTGKLVPMEQNIVMKPLDRTVVKSIDVKVGDVVRKGQKLITFNPEINKAEEERLTSEYNFIKAQYERCQAENDGKNYDPGENPTDDEKNELALFNARRHFYDNKIRYFDESIERVRINIESTKEQLVKQQERLKGIKELVDMEQSLSEKGHGKKVDLINYKMSYDQQASEIVKMQASIAEGEKQIVAHQSEKQTFISEWQKDTTESYISSKRNLVTTKTSLDKVLELNSYIQLTAPCDAIVLEIANFPVGSAVREAEALITLVPISEIEVEAEIPAQDIGKVKVGDSVRVKLNAYPFQKYGTLDGIIRKLSPDAFTKQGAAPIDPEAGKSYYRAWISLSGSLRNVPDTFRLTPGMEVQAEIKVGKRRIIEYILYPLIKALDESAREP